MTLSRTIIRLAAPDYFLMRRINGWRPPHWFQMWMIASTRAGDGWLWGAYGLVLLLSFDRTAYLAFAAAATAAMLGIGTFLLLKRAIGRQRPCTLSPSCWSSLPAPDQYSFPSGHSITAFAVSVPIALCFPDFAAALLLIAGTVALSRLILGMHFLTDVIAGSLIGYLLGDGAYRLYAAFIF